MAVEAIARVAVMEENVAARRLGRVGVLAADLKHVFRHVGDLILRKEAPSAVFFGVYLVPVLRIESYHVRFRAVLIAMTGADAVTHGPLDVRRKKGGASRFEIVAGKTPKLIRQIRRVLLGRPF